MQNEQLTDQRHDHMEMRWAPVTDDHGHTHMEAHWVAVDHPVAIHHAA